MSIEKNPDESNTGARTPKGESKQASKEVLGFIDWISCTFPCQTDIQELKSFLGGTWTRAIGGSNGYSQGIFCGHIKIWYGGLTCMGVHLQASGKGCRELENTTIKKEDWPAFLGELLKRDASFSRLDIALDDHTGILDFAELAACSRAGLVSSRLKAVKYIEDGKIGTDTVIKSGITFGKHESNTELKIYDKAVQRNKTKHHVRVELVTRGINAKTLVKNLAENGIKIIPGVLAATVSFKVAGNDSHKDRLKTLPAWDCFLGDPKKFRLSTNPSEPSLENSIQTLEHQYGPTMAMLVIVYGPDRLLKIAEDGKARLTDKHFSIIKRYPKAC